MEIIFNNRTHQVTQNVTVQSVLNELLGTAQKGIAVAVNDAVIPKAKWEVHQLQPADAVLVIKATQGG